MKIGNNHFKTSDYCLASTLVTLGFSVIDLDHSNSKRIKFSFYETQELEEAVALFWRKKISVSPTAFYNAQRELKTLMYQGGNYAS
jgi:lysophospholipid acyltransferase (LPLAT)-like uncharacterized protein